MAYPKPRSLTGFQPTDSGALGAIPDPLAGKTYGYRGSFQRFLQYQGSDVVGETLKTQKLSYNGFEFPPVADINVSVVPEYDKAGRTVKYLTLAITVDCIITDYYVDEPNANMPTTDEAMRVLRDRLSSPGKNLQILLHGLGNFSINPVSTTPSTYGNTTQLRDLDFGPKPQVLEFDSIGGPNAFQIQWLVTCRISPFSECQTSDRPQILEMFYSTKWKVDRGGFLTRSLTGQAEVSLFPKTVKTAGEPADHELDMQASKLVWRNAVASFRNVFTPLPGFHREEDFSVDETKKVIKYSITDTEIPSPQPYPKGILDLNLRESVSSSFKDGFLIWDWSIGGSISVMRGKYLPSIAENKQLAYTAFGLIVRDRIDRIKNLKIPPKKVPESEGDQYSTEEQEVTLILDKVKIENDIYGNSLNVNVGYKLFKCPTSLLFAATGMFDLVRIPGYTWEEWRKYREENCRENVNGLPIQAQSPSVDIVVDVCHPLSLQATSGEREPFIGSRPYRPILTDDIPSPANSWLAYENNFYFYNEHNTLVGTLLSEEAVDVFEKMPNPNENNVARDTKEQTVWDRLGELFHASYSEELPISASQTAELPTLFVEMRGYAIRLGYTIKAPDLVSVDKNKAISVGTDVIRKSSKRLGLSGRTKDGNSIARPLLNKITWKKRYAIKGLIRLADNDTKFRNKIETTGHPSAYL